MAPLIIFQGIMSEQLTKETSPGTIYVVHTVEFVNTTRETTVQLLLHGHFIQKQNIDLIELAIQNHNMIVS